MESRTWAVGLQYRYSECGGTRFLKGIVSLPRLQTRAACCRWLPPMILQSCSFILSFCWAVAVAFISYATTWRHQHPEPGTPAAAAGNQAATSAVLTAVVAFFASWAVLGFLASLLLNVIDALFVCFAMDRDAGQVGGLGGEWEGRRAGGRVGLVGGGGVVEGWGRVWVGARTGACLQSSRKSPRPPPLCAHTRLHRAHAVVDTPTH